MELQEFKSFIEENKDSDEVRDLIKSFAPTPDFNTALEDEGFQKALKSYADKEAARQVEAFKSNTLPKTVEDEVAKRLDAQSHKEPWQIKLEEMEKKQADLMNQLKEKERRELIGINKTKALQMLSEKKLPTDLVDHIVSDEEDKTMENTQKLISVFENYGQSLKQQILKNNNTFVPGESGTGSQGDVDEFGITKPAPDESNKSVLEDYYRKRKLASAKAK